MMKRPPIWDPQTAMGDGIKQTCSLRMVLIFIYTSHWNLHIGLMICGVERRNLGAEKAEFLTQP